MESNKELIFKVMVTFPHVLEREILDYNEYYGTNFEIIETIYDDVPFCKIKVSKYNIANIFGLGYSLSSLENKLKEEGEIDW